MINADVVSKLKPGLTLLNVSRGALIDTNAVIEGLASGQIGCYGARDGVHSSVWSRNASRTSRRGARQKRTRPPFRVRLVSHIACRLAVRP